MGMIPTKANDFAPWSHKQIADYFWENLGSYVKEPCFQTLQNMKYAWLWAVHDDYELAKTFGTAMRWSGINDIYAEFEKHGWDERM